LATSFPSGLDALTNPTSADGLNSPDHAGQHANVNDAVEALEAKVGVDSSAVVTSLDYKLATLSTSSGFVPIGAVTMYSGSTAPTNWAICNGAELAIATYGPLYAIIGTRYGALTNGSGGVGTTHFKLPAFTSRIPKGTVGIPTVPTTITSGVSSAVDVHTHTVNSTFTAGNAAAHTHAIGGSSNTQSANHSHVYFKPNAGANANSDNQSVDHTHGLPANSGNANTTISVNSSLTAGDASTINASTTAHTHGVDSVDIVFIIRVA